MVLVVFACGRVSLTCRFCCPEASSKSSRACGCLGGEGKKVSEAVDTGMMLVLRDKQDSSMGLCPGHQVMDEAGWRVVRHGIREIKPYGPKQP